MESSKSAHMMLVITALSVIRVKNTSFQQEFFTTGTCENIRFPNSASYSFSRSKRSPCSTSTKQIQLCIMLSKSCTKLRYVGNKIWGVLPTRFAAAVIRRVLQSLPNRFSNYFQKTKTNVVVRTWPITSES